MPDTSMPWRFFAVSAAQNADAIFSELLPRFEHGARVFEIGSGTGQHAVHACTLRPDLIWQPSEQPLHLANLETNLREHPTTGMSAPIACDVLFPPPAIPEFDLAYTANTLHIMSELAVQSLFSFVASVLTADGIFYSYGPFLFDNRPAVASNLRFDEMLRADNPEQGVRSVSWLEKVAQDSGLHLHDALDMPSNNHILVWRKDVSN